MNAIKNILTLILILYVAVPLFSQNQELAKIQLLKEKLNTAKEDTSKVLLLQSLSFQYNSIDPRIGLKYGEQSLELAEDLKFEKAYSDCYNSIGGNQFAMGDLKHALETFRKAVELNEKNGCRRETL